MSLLVGKPTHYGDVEATSTLHIWYSTNNGSGAAVNPSGTVAAADFVLYKDGSAVQRTSTSGITVAPAFDGVAGLHLISIDLSDDTDVGFYSVGGQYALAFTPNETVDTQTVVEWLAVWNITSSLTNSSATGAAINTSAESYTLTTGTESSGALANTVALDGVTHQHTDDTGALDLYYQFDVGGDGVPTSVKITGRINGANDSLDGVYAYNWAGASWDRIGDFIGKAPTVNDTLSFDLFTAHVGTGADLGKVRVRLWAASGLTTATLHVDQIFASYAVLGRGNFYEGGAVWLDTTVSNTNTESFVDGTVENPVSTIAAATTLAGNLNLKVIHVLPGSAVTLAQAYDDYEFIGFGYTMDLGGQSIEDTLFQGARVSGTGIATTTAPVFDNCSIGTATLPPSVHKFCIYTGTFTVGSAGDFFINDGRSGVAGTSKPTIDLGAIGATSLNIRSWSGGLGFLNVAAGDVISAEFENGGTCQVDGTGGSVYVRGRPTSVVDDSSALVTVDTSGVVNRTTIEAEVIDSIVEGTTTVRQSLALSNAAAAGKISGVETGTLRMRSQDDGVDRITGSVDSNGNRTAITTDFSDF